MPRFDEERSHRGSGARWVPRGLAGAVALSTLASVTPAEAEWLELATLQVPATASVQNSFYGRSVACSRDTVLVGASGEDSSTGAVYAFSGPSFATVQRLVPPDPERTYNFGAVLSLSGDTVLVGSSQIDNGHARFFVRESGEWKHQQTLLSEGPARTGAFGHGVFVRGDVAVISAPKEGGDTGRLYVYRRSDGTWTEAAQLFASDGTNSDFFGLGLAFDGTAIAASAPTNPLLGTERGSISVFVSDGAAWTEQVRLDRVGQDPAPPALYFAGALALDGDRLVATGARGTDETLEPRLFFYERSGSTWTLAHTLVSTGDTNIAAPKLQGDRLFAVRSVETLRTLQEYQRGTGGEWTATQAFEGFFTSTWSNYAVCGDTLAIADGSNVKIFRDATLASTPDPATPDPSAPPTSGPSAPEEPAPSDGGGCAMSRRGLWSTGVGAEWAVALAALAGCVAGRRRRS